MDPYETDLEKIRASDDPYNDIPSHGRYLAQPDDFRPLPKHIGSTSPGSLAYWKEVIRRCTEAERIYPNDSGGRDVFALGGVIVKSSHLNEDRGRDYALADANEIAAIELARPALAELQIRVPEIYFAGKIDGHSVLVQERIPGVGLNVAWRYLSPDQKHSFKQQIRAVLRKLHEIQPGSTDTKVPRSYVVPDPDPVANRGIQTLERDIIFTEHAGDPDVGLVHMDQSQSNCIVGRGDRIVAIVDWEMAGFFGWATAADVHRRIRSPRRENYANVNIPEELMRDILYWNDIYECDERLGDGLVEQ
ncbi:hypothetical protein MAPG_09532 [Magnaporthiopsis poae ATCC 64411]|uniref:Aminoglycoside phosphotransferase domain-containing protein n=1 Tax=Magnaporthiopsis poae (strain ATCC 64411 / 73-15) TaxID=644358 RepID=A0A0C4EA73_MAGP6|nr:hypothetical protein MAPG_09532 [Magnaporthiopsis poae ATCC 64411]